MTNSPKPTDPPNPLSLLRDLQTNEDLRHQPIESAGLDPQHAMLREWQSARLARTYADLLSDKRYQTACQFFLTDIYAPRDFSQRDHDAERIHNFLAGVFPPNMLRLFSESLELNRLSAQLDDQILAVLYNDMQLDGPLTDALYAEAYRRCDNRPQREHQLVLTTRLAQRLGEVSRLFLVGVGLRVVKGPAYQAGWKEVYDFLERAFDAFRQVKDPAYFASTIEQRETQILERIYARDPDPLRLDTPDDRKA